MAGFHGQDGASCGQIGCTHNVCRGAQVGADAHAFEDGGSRDEALDVGDTKVVRAGGHWGCAGLGEGAGQKGNVGGLVRGDFLQVGVKGRVKTGRCEGGFVELLETLLIEGVFEMLEGEGIVEDVGVGDRWGGLTDFLQKGATARASERHSSKGKSARLAIYVWETGLAAAIAANAPTANAAFMAVGMQLRVLVFTERGRVSRWNLFVEKRAES